MRLRKCLVLVLAVVVRLRKCLVLVLAVVLRWHLLSAITSKPQIFSTDQPCLFSGRYPRIFTRKTRVLSHRLSGIIPTSLPTAVIHRSS
jgi:hypothetical protein